MEDPLRLLPVSPSDLCADGAEEARADHRANQGGAGDRRGACDVALRGHRGYRPAAPRCGLREAGDG